MKAKAIQMKNDLAKVPALLDKKSKTTLEAWAEAEGRSAQSHYGILLRRLARLFDERPEKLEEIGILTPHVRAIAA